MIPVSNTWKEAVKQQFRFQAYMEATVEVVPPSIALGQQAETDDTSDISTVSTLTDRYESVRELFGSLNPGRFPLTGAYKFPNHGSLTDIWWSNKPTATITFNYAEPTTIAGLTITWDLETNSWPESFSIVMTDSTGQTSTATFHPIKVKDFYQAEMDNVVALTINVSQWNTPDWFPRIAEITFGLLITFESINNGRIKEAHVQDASNPLSEEQPTHSLDVTFRNIDEYFDPQLKSGLSKYLAQKQLFTMRWGFVTSYGTTEWSPNLKYIIDEFRVPADSKDVQFNLTNRLALLTDDFKLGTFTGQERSLWDIATYVLQNSSIIRDTQDVDPWVLDEGLKAIKTTAPIPTMATNTLLQLIAVAGCCYLKIRSTDGAVVFHSNIADTTSHDVGLMQENGDPEITILDRLRSITCNIYTYTIAAEASTIANAKYVLDDVTEISISYEPEFAVEVAAAVSGGTLRSATYYASSAKLVVAPVSSGDEVTVTLTGKEVTTTVSSVETYRDTTIANGVDISIDSPFVTSLVQLSRITEYAKRYYNRRTRYKIPYIGYPELEAGDIINLTTVYGSDVADVVKNDIDFNGAWEGTLETI